MKIRVVVTGATGRMGREVLRAVRGDDALELVGAVDIRGAKTDVGELIGASPTGITVSSDLDALLSKTPCDVMVDFTNAGAAMANIRTALGHGVSPVVGTTGLSEADITSIEELCREKGIGAVISPNFSVGAIMMVKLATEAARYFPHVEIIELHHDQKIDAPSGTALHTAEVIAKGRRAVTQGHPGEIEKLAGARGGNLAGIRVHSVRLPGFVAHQEVIFGGLGQTLTIRHDSISRESFMPGVLLAIKKVKSLNRFVYGLENLLD